MEDRNDSNRFLVNTVRECVYQLVMVIHGSSTQLNTLEEKGIALDIINNELVAYLKLKEWVSE